MPMDPYLLNEEPSLRDVLIDPIVHAVMAGDGTTREEIERLVAAVRIKLKNSDHILCNENNLS